MVDMRHVHTTGSDICDDKYARQSGAEVLYLLFASSLIEISIY